MLGGLLGTIAGAAVAGHLYRPLVDWVQLLIGEQSGWLKLIVFIIIFIIINRLVGFVFYIISQTFHFISVIPFLKSIDRLLGALLGLLEGALVLGLTLYFASRLDLPLLFQMAIAASSVATRLIDFASVLVPLLPEVVRHLQPFIPGVNAVVPE